MGVKGQHRWNLDEISKLCDGKRKSAEIAQIIGNGCTADYVQGLMKKYNLPRLKRGAGRGDLNPAYKCGRRIDDDGYVLVRAPEGHQTARRDGSILEHRLVMETHLGRYLKKSEVVDHIDECVLHNHIDNLRVFEGNAAHLKKTIAGRVPVWSEKGFQKMSIVPHLRPNFQRIDIHSERCKLGELRLRQILLAWLLLGKDSPYLLGTTQYLERAQVDYSSPTTIKEALNHLYQRWGWDLVP